eukprot:gnl/MRDRNA2_/MRDRNA2_154946_c0_seq1.p1 gnl/MRDRNA2_/MRDRNA2_154946_c0~~gnl/MRDRNA2_/MRDRNA2_154946_c0_seq1.p1  ORF type:complete len:170 (+),score=39.16 gnl/MRDRNA2_/MRDRNA2_154946_c0_seq1:2-511(+)
MDDAELYLNPLGIPTDLPKLEVKFGSISILGGSQFAKGQKLHQRKPHVLFDTSLGKCTLVCVDPDAPDREGDGSGPGMFGPWLHWLVTDAEGDHDSGNEIVEYMGPAPPRGNHRYIFVLFQQTADVVQNPSGVERKQWDFPGFLKANPGLKPVASNFFYARAKEDRKEL